ncbi:MAG: hypothetical protein AB8B53_12035 [Flavobacteriales bacterium]
MKSLKSLVLSAALLLSLAIMAQDQKARTQENIKQLTEQLDLTAEQQAEVALIFKEIKKERASLRTNESLDRTAKKNAAKELKERADAKLKAALNEKQYAKLKSLKEEQRTAKKLQKVERKNAKYEKLGLSEDQKIQIESLNEKMRAKKQRIRENSSMNDADKKTALKQLRSTSDESLKGILTAEQYKQFKEMKKEKRGGKGKQRMQEKPQK